MWLFWQTLLLQLKIYTCMNFTQSYHSQANLLTMWHISKWNILWGTKTIGKDWFIRILQTGHIPGWSQMVCGEGLQSYCTCPLVLRWAGVYNSFSMRAERQAHAGDWQWSKASSESIKKLRKPTLYTMTCKKINKRQIGSQLHFNNLIKI